MSYESRRYSTVENFRTKAVEEAYLYRPNALYRPPQPWKRDLGFAYSRRTLPKGQFATIDEALAAVRKAFRNY